MLYAILFTLFFCKAKSKPSHDVYRLTKQCDNFRSLYHFALYLPDIFFFGFGSQYRTIACFSLPLQYLCFFFFFFFFWLGCLFLFSLSFFSYLHAKLGGHNVVGSSLQVTYSKLCKSGFNFSIFTAQTHGNHQSSQHGFR